jgi:hypothetical protein
MENGKQSAFATASDSRYQAGLTKREYFAALAMQGLIACQHDGFTGDEIAVVTRAVRYADALLAELDKEK